MECPEIGASGSFYAIEHGEEAAFSERGSKRDQDTDYVSNPLARTQNGLLSAFPELAISKR
jgi:hypothetical protein